MKKTSKTKVKKSRVPHRATAKSRTTAHAAPAPIRNEQDDIVRLSDEPWVMLPDGKALSRWSKQDEIRYNQGNRQAENEFPEI